MLFHKSCLVAVTTIALGMLGVGLAYAQSSDDPQRDCEGLYDAFTNYSSTLNDPDKDAATAMAKEGLEDCKNDKHADGMQKISSAIGGMHDGKASYKN